MLPFYGFADPPTQTAPQRPAQDFRYPDNEPLINALLESTKAELPGLMPAASVPLYRGPGAWEIPVCAGYVMQYTGADVIICLGIVIRRETAHADLITQSQPSLGTLYANHENAGIIVKEKGGDYLISLKATSPPSSRRSKASLPEPLFASAPAGRNDTVLEPDIASVPLVSESAGLAHPGQTARIARTVTYKKTGAVITGSRILLSSLPWAPGRQASLAIGHLVRRLRVVEPERSGDSRRQITVTSTGCGMGSGRRTPASARMPPAPPRCCAPPCRRRSGPAAAPA